MGYPNPGTRQRSVYMIDTFRGINYTDDPSNVDDTQSPYAPNMIRDVPGKVRKCMGYHTVLQFEGRINGYHKLRSEDAYLIHAGTNLYRVENDTPALLYSEANDARSRSFQFSMVSGQVLVIQDGKALLIYDGKTVETVASRAYIPTITIAKGSDKATSYDAVNLLQPKYRESFYSESATSFTLSLTPLDEGSEVLVEWLNESAEWQDIGDKVSKVDYATGTITLSEAQKVNITGEDNIRITAQKTVEGYGDRINKCDVGIQFGVNGAADRLFVGGNPDMDFLNCDWFSGQNDPTYWPDTSYAAVGNPASAIMGYSIVNNYLATHKDNRETDRNVVVRQGNLVNSEPAFPIINTMQGPGAVAKWSFAYLETEPVFLTGSGVYAITTSDLSGDRYSQRRSYYCNGALLKEELEGAYACIHNDMYWLCVGGKAYILDGLQAIQTSRSDPYSSRQYACFERTNLPARCMWEAEGNLYFGTEGGKVCAFYTDKDSPTSYNDDGEAIKARWRTPDFSGRLFFKNKSFRYLAMQLTPAIVCSVEMWGRKRGLWTLLAGKQLASRFFTFTGVVFDKMTFATDATTKTLHTKTHIKKVDKTSYEFRNDNVNEPFGLMSYAVEYTEHGNYKK